MSDEVPRVIITAIQVSDEYCEDVLVTCVEGGSNYWGEFRNIVRNPVTMGVTSLDVVISEDGDPEEIRSIDLVSIKTAVEIVMKPDFPISSVLKRYIVEDDNDAESSDLLLQVAVFGTVVYS